MVITFEAGWIQGGRHVHERHMTDGRHCPRCSQVAMGRNLDYGSRFDPKPEKAPLRRKTPTQSGYDPALRPGNTGDVSLTLTGCPVNRLESPRSRSTVGGLLVYTVHAALGQPVQHLLAGFSHLLHRRFQQGHVAQRLGEGLVFGRPCFGQG